jgi:hypothetical protein
MNIMIEFLNSSFFLAIVTIIAGLAALAVYYKGKFDLKRDAANIILLEIQNAERQLKRVKENLSKVGTLMEDVFVMPSESWSKYKYLFVRKFDRDEWDTISEFFNKCSLYDDAVDHSNSCFVKNEDQIRINIQRIFAEFCRDSDDTSEILDQKVIDRFKRFRQRYLKNQSPELGYYSPQKPLTDANIYLADLESTITQTTIGNKLKKVATSRFLWRW